MKKLERIFLLDFFRGCAVCGMILFHLLWDINFFSIIPIALYSGFIGAFQQLVLFSFVFLSGFSLIVSFQRTKSNFFSKWVWRVLFLFAVAFAITFVSWFLFPAQPILFGVIHLVAFSTLISLPLLKHKRLSIICSVFILASPFLLQISSFAIPPLFFFGFAFSPPALDFVPVFPWAGVFLLGVFFAQNLVKNGLLVFKFFALNSKPFSFVSFLGRHSLLVYLLHQIILFPLVFLVSLLLGFAPS
jgi:uncharacterized membrane protein